MELFSTSPLTVAGRPILENEEVEIKSEDIVSVWNQENKKIVNQLFPSGLIILTNIRLILITQQITSTSSSIKKSSIGWAIFLKDISFVEDCAVGKLLGNSKRIRILFIGKCNEIGLKFEVSGKDEFLNALNKTLQKKSWESIVPTKNNKSINNSASDQLGFSVTNAGVSGIIRRQEQTIKNVDDLQKSALTDLDALIERAREAITVIQRYASIITENDSNDINDEVRSETASEINEMNEMENIMLSIGIISPVTKFSAGRQYHQQLARQIVDLLLTQRRLERLGGMITLTDLYCIVNRARGTELVSPDDLFKAAELTGKLSLGMRLRAFKSGVKLLQLDAYNDDEVGQKIVKIFEQNEEFSQNGITVSHVATLLNTSLIVAKEQLLVAELNCLLCRDDTIDGIYFFPNLFASMNI